MPVPTVQVLLDDAANGRTFPHDITAKVSMRDGISRSTRGRADELSNVSPVAVSLTVDNTDGRFTLGSTSGGYGAINVMRGIRIKVNGVNWFTGFVSAWPVDWPSGSERDARSQMLAVDARERWGRRVLRTRASEQAKAEGAAAFWAFDEPSEAVAAADSSGNNAPAIELSGFGLTEEAFIDGAQRRGMFTGSSLQLRSNSMGIVGGTPGYCYDAFNGVPYPGRTMPKPIRWVSFKASTNASSSGWPIVSVVAFNGAVWYFQLTTSTVSWWDGSSLIHYADVGAGEHTFMFLADGTDAKIYVDGVLARTAYYVSAPATPDDHSGVMVLTQPTFTATVSNLSVGYNIPADPAQTAANLNWSQTLGTAYDTLGVRTGWATEGLGAPPAPFSTLVGQTRMCGREVNGTSVAQVVDDASATEGGVVYINGSGEWEAHGRDFPALRTTPDLTVSANTDAITPDLTVNADLQGQVTTAQCNRPNGAVQIVTNQAMEEICGASTHTAEYEVFTDAEVLDRAAWLVATRSEITGRIPYLTLDLLTADAGLATSVLAFPVDGHLRITDLPAQTPGGTTRDFWVLGHAEQITDNSWTWTANVVDWPTYCDVFILDDASRGVLDDDRLGV